MSCWYPLSHFTCSPLSFNMGQSSALFWRFHRANWGCTSGKLSIASSVTWYNSELWCSIFVLRWEVDLVGEFREFSVCDTSTLRTIFEPQHSRAIQNDIRFALRTAFTVIWDCRQQSCFPTARGNSLEQYMPISLGQPYLRKKASCTCASKIKQSLSL